MYENPQTVVLPEKTKMDNIISATLYLLSTGTWKANAFPYADIVQKASTPLDIIYCLDRSSRLSAVNFLGHTATSVFFKRSRKQRTNLLGTFYCKFFIGAILLVYCRCNIIFPCFESMVKAIDWSVRVNDYGGHSAQGDNSRREYVLLYCLLIHYCLLREVESLGQQFSLCPK